MTGEEALEKILLGADLVLMDIMLPGEMDGIEAEALRSRTDIPAAYLTAHTDHATFLRSKSTMPYGYIVKPIRDIEPLGGGNRHPAAQARTPGEESEARFRTLAHFTSDWE